MKSSFDSIVSRVPICNSRMSSVLFLLYVIIMLLCDIHLIILSMSVCVYSTSLYCTLLYPTILSPNILPPTILYSTIVWWQL